MSRRHSSLAAIVALVVVVSAGGCGAIYDYPDQHAETGNARCDDGADNDFDGDIDHDDADCATPESGSAACHDGEDNDLDRKVDQLDPDCATPESGAACRDGQDNDLDRKVDQLDPDCAESESDYEACHDGLDNDIDGEPDERDPDCEVLWQERSEAACLDPDARDEDEDGRANCADPDCGAFCPEGTSTPGTCADGIDNDADERTDCDDVVDCAGSCPEDDAGGDARCTDEVDNDGDGYVDGSDPLCWPLLAPEVQRCSLQGATLDETFDSTPIGSDPRGSSWYQFGFENGYPFGQGPPPGRVTRSDLALDLGFDPNETVLAGVGSRSLLSGKWADFELEVSVSVMPGALVQLSLVPVDQAPDNEAPRAGIELLTIAVTATNTERTATLEQGGRSVSVSTPAPAACGQELCEGGFERFILKLDDGELVARFADEPLPRLAIVGLGDSAPRARIVVTGRGSLVGGGAFLDDLHARFARSLPCGFFVPQMPNGGPNECALPVAGGSMGSAISAAAGPDGYCALSSRTEAEPIFTQGPVLVPAPSVQAWRSVDGDHWQHGHDGVGDSEATGDVPVGVEVDVIGQAVAWDPEQLGWVAAVAYRDASLPLPDPGLWLQLFTSGDCIAWQEIGDELALPEDAEPPSLLVEPSGELHAYFTRPATSATGRTLWRMALGSADDLRSVAEPLPVVELGPELHVDPPVSLQRVGADYVLSYRLDASAGAAGLGVAVSDRRLELFRPTAVWPLMRPNTQVAFDDLELLSGTVLWKAGGGLLLYAARGSQGSFQTISGGGTALLRPAGSTPRLPDSEPPAPHDTPVGPSAPSLLDDAQPWILTPDESAPFEPAARHFYVDPVLERLQYAEVSFSSSPVLYRSLPAELTAGDFELSFELQLSASRSSSSRFGSDCSSQVGLARGEPTDTSPTDSAPSEGVFAELLRSYECFAPVNWLGAAAVTADSRWSSFSGADVFGLPDGSEACSGVEVTDTSEWQHVTLRRENGTVRVTNRRETPCGRIEGSVAAAYEGALDGLDKLIVRGNGCGLTFALRNVAIRSLRDVSACDETVCSDGAASVCVDLEQNPEHCGTCTTACRSGSRCIDGECRCRAGLVDCGTTCVVEDSPGNCGGCGLDPCGDGTCVFGACSVNVGEACDDPSLVPPEGGIATFRLGDRTQLPDHVPCGNDFFHDAAFRWMPSESGPVTIEVSSTSARGFDVPVLLAVTEDASCGASSGSHCDDTFDTSGARVTLDAQAGTPYFIVVGSYDPAPPIAPLALRVRPVSP